MSDVAAHPLAHLHRRPSRSLATIASSIPASGSPNPETWHPASVRTQSAPMRQIAASRRKPNLAPSYVSRARAATRHRPPPHAALHGGHRGSSKPSTRRPELDDIARRVARSRRQLQRAYAEIGHTTFREHLTRVRMERAGRAARERLADRARGRAARRLPPAGAVRQDVPPPPRRRSLGVPHAASGPSRAPAARSLSSSPPVVAATTFGTVFRSDHRSDDLQATSPFAVHPACRIGSRPESCEGARDRTRRCVGTRSCRWSPLVRSRLRSASRLALLDQLVPGRRREAGPADRHALRRADDRLDPDLRARADGDPLLRLGVPHAPRPGERGRRRRSTATRASRSSGPRSRRSSSCRSAATPTAS